MKGAIDGQMTRSEEQDTLLTFIDDRDKTSSVS